MGQVVTTVWKFEHRGEVNTVVLVHDQVTGKYLVELGNNQSETKQVIFRKDMTLIDNGREITIQSKIRSSS